MKVEKNDKIRVVFEVSPEVNDIIEGLASRLGITKVEVVRRSLSLYEDAVKEVRDRNGEIIFDNSTGKRKILI